MVAKQELKFLRTVKGCSKLDRIRNNDITNELNIFDIYGKIREFRTNEGTDFQSITLQICHQREYRQIDEKLGTATSEMPKILSEKEEEC